MSQYTKYPVVSGGGGGTVTTVTASSPLSSSGGTTPNLTIQVASDSQPGALSATDHAAFSAKQPAGSYITSLTGGVTASGPGASAATVITNANLTGPITSAGNATAVASQTGTGSTFVMDTSPTLVTPNLGTPTTLVGTNISGTASGLTAGNVTINANLTGDITSVGNATTLTNAPVIAKVLTGYTSGAGTVASTDSILTAIQKLNGNAAGTAITAKVIYVSQDTGNDSNPGTLYKPLKTIQAGINAANAIAAYYNQVIVNVSPSSTNTGYNENLTLSQQGVTVQGFSPRRSDSVLLIGTVTINLTGVSGGGNFVAASNIVSLKSIVISSGASAGITFGGTTFQRLEINDCYVSSGNASALVMTNTGTSAGTKSTITSRDTDYFNSSAASPVILQSAGNLYLAGATPTVQNNNAATAPSLTVDGASATGGTFSVTNGQITGQITVSDNLAMVYLAASTISSGSVACVVTPSSANTGFVSIGNVGLNTTATNSITGSGIVALQNVSKLSTGGDIISTVTQSPFPLFPQGATMIGAGSTQNAHSLLTIKNGHVTSQQTTAPTSALQTGAGSTASRTLTRCTDTAGNISITVAGTGIASGAQLIVTFNTSYATAPVVVLTPTNANAALVVGAYVTSSTTTFTINFAAAGTTATAYTFTYHVIET
jgi:hypothetical protein